jgi:hypothetical protein
MSRHAPITSIALAVTPALPLVSLWAHGLPNGVFGFVPNVFALIVFLAFLPLVLGLLVRNWRWFLRDVLHIRDRRVGVERRQRQFLVSESGLVYERRGGERRRARGLAAP